MGLAEERTMRRAGLALAAVATLSACIPGADPPYRGEPPRRSPSLPPREAYRDDGRPEPQRVESDREARPAREQDTPVAKLPAPRPAWESRPVAADARTIAASTYTVRPGDTLRGVAETTGAGSETIARANDLPPPFTIRPGQRLTIPAGRYHLVQPGQTGIAIARAYGVEWSRIVTANALEEPYTLRVGQRIVIPGGESGRAPSRADRAAAFTLDVDDILPGGEPALASNQAPARPDASPRRVLPATAAVVAPTRLQGGFVWPVDGRVVKRFGPGASGERNDGIKIAVPVSTPIKAAADGVVAYVGDGIAALGGLVIVKHGDGWTTVYGHASKLLVRRGQSVRRGETIALSGDTGFADRPEVHFELRKGRTPVDPLGQLPRT
jgi:murein DD-endopeptidase MepM/ murein hydrolase activator NlpD